MVPGPTSSNDLLLEMLREFLAADAQDKREGFTMRALHRRVEERTGELDDRLEEHTQVDENEFRRVRMEGRQDIANLQAEIRQLAERVARGEGRDDFAEKTGRFNAPPPMSVHIDTKPSKRPTIPPLVKPFVKPVAAALALILTAVVTHLLTRWGVK